MVSEAMNLRPPTSFSFMKVDEWPKWKQRFEQYRLASGLVEKDEQRQVSTLLYCLGEEAEEVLNATRITEEEKKKYQRVIEQFDAYFQVRRNVKMSMHASTSASSSPTNRLIGSSLKCTRWQNLAISEK